MGADTAIEWATHTFNPWTGCTRVSPGCDHCYAAEQAKRNPRTFGSWEYGGARKRTSAAYWQQPLRWNRDAERTGTRPRVFCASMADVFDNQVPEEWRWSLWRLIASTPHLDWLLLTKRPQNIARMLPEPTLASMEDTEEGPWHAPWPWPNVWLGTTVENQAEADRRIPHLLAVPARVRFLSCEPLLGPVDLTAVRWPCEAEHYVDVLRGGYWNMAPFLMNAPSARPGEPRGGFTNHTHMPGWPGMIGWIIAGGESGGSARPMHPDWARSLRDQCAAAGVPFFFKQWGEWFPGEIDNLSDGSGWVAQPDVEHDPSADLWEGRWTHNSAVGTGMLRAGKRRAGRLLDGVQHDGVPA